MHVHATVHSHADARVHTSAMWPDALQTSSANASMSKITRMHAHIHAACTPAYCKNSHACAHAMAHANTSAHAHAQMLVPRHNPCALNEPVHFVNRARAEASRKALLRVHAACLTECCMRAHGTMHVPSHANAHACAAVQQHRPRVRARTVLAARQTCV